MGKVLSKEDIRQMIEDNSDCIFINKYKEKGQIIVDLRCDCGNTFTQRLSKFKNSPYKKCKKCICKVKISPRKFKKEDVDFYLNKYDLKILEDYKSVDHESLFQCGCGRNFYSSFYKIKKSKYKKCRICVGNISGERQSWTHDQFLDKISNLKNIDEYEILTKYKRSFEKIKILHKKCNTITELTPKNLINGQRCSRCSKSMGEIKIRDYLTNNNINFIPEYRFNECIDLRPLPFDFYLPEYNIAIEMQGEIHYEEFLYGRSKGFFGGVSGFLKRKKHDLLKTRFCRKNNVKLIHINYYEKNTINKTLKYLLKR